MKISAVEVALCELPITRPIKLGSVEMKTRDYVVLRLITDGNLYGFGIGYRSGTQLIQAVCDLAPRFLGRDPLMRREILGDVADGLIPARLSVARALSLFDIALWDIASKVAGLPLFQLLGGYRNSVRTLAVAGFAHLDRDVQEIIAEVAELCDSGVSLIKIMIGKNDPVSEGRYVERIAAAVAGGSRLAVDAHWTWRTLGEALQTCRRIDDLGLAFLEDPFLRNNGV